MADESNISPTVPIPDLITQDPDDAAGAKFIRDRFGVVDAFALAMYWAAINYINQLANKEYQMPWNPLEYAKIPLGGLSGLDLTGPPIKPTVDDIDVSTVEFPFTAPIPPTLDISIGDIPPFTAVLPDFLIPDAPDVTWPVFTATQPSLSDITFPIKPDYELPPLPTLSDVSIPSPPNIALPSFDGVFPSMDLTPPDPMFVWNEAEYDSDILQALAAKILTNVENGGTGLGADIEAAIWARALARQSIENDNTYSEALDFWAARGYDLPPGAVVSRLAEVRARIDQINEDLNNDILIQQSKLAQENTHFFISAAIDYEKMLMEELNRRQDRAFQAAKYVVEGAILIYQARVTAYQAQLEAYRTLATVYEVRIRAEIAKVEIYKAQIEGAKLTVEIQALMIEAYKAQLQGITALIDTYRAEMEAANIQAQIDKTRIDSFSSLVNAYSAEVGAVTARFNAYQAQIAGEVAKADMYKSQAQAYVAQVEGYKAQADVSLTEAKTLVALHSSEVDTYRALIDKYKTDIDNALSRAEITAKQQGFEVAMYEADIKEYATEIDGLTKIYAAQVDENRGLYDLQIKEADVQLRTAVAMYELEAEGIKSSAQIAAQLGSASLTAVSASAHLGYSESRSDNRGHSTAQTGSQSYSSHRDLSASAMRNSTSESHTYVHND